MVVPVAQAVQHGHAMFVHIKTPSRRELREISAQELHEGLLLVLLQGGEAKFLGVLESTHPMYQLPWCLYTVYGAPGLSAFHES